MLVVGSWFLSAYMHEEDMLRELKETQTFNMLHSVVIIAQPGEINGNSILTEDNVRELRHQVYRYGMYSYYAKKFNVNIETIRAAYLGRSWQYLNES